MNSPVSFPIPTLALQEFLPHRPPMVWIDQVLSASVTDGECEVTLDQNSLPFSEGGLRQSSLIEWMAQGFGFSQASVTDKKSSRAYLAALSNVEYCEESAWNEFSKNIRPGEKVIVKVSIKRTLPPVTLVNGEVQTQSGFTLAKASFKVFVEPGTR